MEPILAQENGEDGAHLLEAEGDLTAFLLAGIGDHGEMRRVNFKPGRLGGGTERRTEDRREEAYAKRNRQNSRHGRPRAEGFRKCYHGGLVSVQRVSQAKGKATRRA